MTNRITGKRYTLFIEVHNGTSDRYVKKTNYEKLDFVERFFISSFTI